MEVLRTPDERFADLPAYPFPPHYVDVPDGEGGSLRVHYVDEGNGPTVLLMHGEPSWSFLYRHVIPPLVEAGLRCVAPDLVGFGRSDKPAARPDYTYQRHVDWMRAALFERLDLRGVSLFGQDWGGLIGLRLAAEHPDRFERIVIGNTGLPTGDAPTTDAFLAWRKFSQEAPVFDVGFIVSSGTKRGLTAEEVAAYNAPFPEDAFTAGARAFPLLVPISADDPAVPANRAAWEVLERWDKPFLCAFSDGDPITAGGERTFLRRVPGARQVTVEEAGHFLQEDKGPELAGVIAGFVRT